MKTTEKRLLRYLWNHFVSLLSPIPTAVGCLLLLSVPTSRAAIPTLVAEEPSLRSIDTVELFGNGLYWWTSSSCTETRNPGGATQIVYTDPRLLSASASLYKTGAGSSGGFKPGDIYDTSLALSAKASLPRGDLPIDCGYGSYFVRDNEAFYYVKDRTLMRKSLTASIFAAGEPMRAQGRLLPVPITADGVVFATDTELWWYAFDIPRNTLTLYRTWKKPVTTKFEEVLSLQGLSMKKFGIADVIATDGSYFTSSLILLTMDGRLYLASATGNPQLIKTGVSDFAFRNEHYTVSGPLGFPKNQQSTALYIAMGNPLTLQGPSQLVRHDLSPGGLPDYVEFPAAVGFTVTSVAVDSKYIFVTRTPSSGLANSTLYSRRAPAKPTLLDLGDPEFGAISFTREFRSLRSSGKQVYFAHGNTVQTVPSAALPVRIDFEAYGLEVTQGIQTMDNSVDLVTARPMMVRGYARVADNTGASKTFDVPARLRVQHQAEGGLPIWIDVEGSPFLPDQSPLLQAPAALSADRTNLQATYLFQLPASVAREGKLRFELLLNEGGAVPETGINPLANNVATAILPVRAIATPELVFARMAYGGSAYDPAAPGSQFWEIIHRAEAMLPINGFSVRMRNAIVYKPKLTFTGIKFRSFDMPDNEDAALMWLMFARTFDSRPANSHYVGMFPNDVKGFNGKGNNPGNSLIMRMGTETPSGAIYNAPYGGRTLAHEFSHNFRFNHIKSDLSCGNAVPDGPFDTLPNGASACTLGATDLENVKTAIGFDPLTWSLVMPGSNGDLMSYATTRWMSAYNWMRMLTLFNLSYKAFQPPPPAPLIAGNAGIQLQGIEDEPLLLVSGILNGDGTSGTLFPATTIAPGILSAQTVASLREIPEEIPADYPVRVQILDAAGTVLVDEPAPLSSAVDEDSKGQLFQRALPLSPEASKLQLVSQGTVVSEIAVSAHAPVVTLDPVVPGPTTLDVHWTATDEDGDVLYTTVQYSPDDGATWNTLSIQNPESSQSFDTSLLPGGTTARVRVIVTDGFHSAVATSDSFEVARHLPTVRVDGLSEGQQFNFGDTITAIGTGYDAEDGSLLDASLVWTVSGPETRTFTGKSLSLSGLPPGVYQLVLTGTDTDGGTGSVTLQFVVRSLAVAEGPDLVLDGLGTDAAYNLNPRVRFGVRQGRYSTGRFAHSQGSLWVIMTGLPYGQLPGAIASAGLRVDTTSSGQLGPNAVGFAVDDQGGMYRSEGNGSTMVALASPPQGFAFQIIRDESAWSLEMRIADSLLGGWNGNAGMVMLQDDGDASTPPETWPATVDLANPAGWSVAKAGPLPPLSSDGNLLPYGNAEGLVGGDGSTAGTLPGWTVQGNLAVVGWNAPGGFPSTSDPGPEDRGANYFAGGPGSAQTTATTTVRLPVSPEKIDAGAIVYELSAWLGGFQDQEDAASLSASFLDASGAVIDRVVLGPVTAADRGSVTGILQRSATATVPAGSRSVEVVLDLVRAGGNYNDAYADNLRLVVREGTLPVASNLPPVAGAGSDQVVEVEGGETIALDGSTSQDPEGGALTYVWSQVSGPPLSFANGDTAAPSFVAPVVDAPVTWVFSLVVNDGIWDSAPATVSVTLQRRVVVGEIRVASIALDSQGDAVLLCTGPAGRMLQLERTLGLETPVWEPVGQPVLSDGNPIEFRDPIATANTTTEAPPQAFYRLRDVTE